MLSERWKTWLVSSLLASATCLAVACGKSNSSSSDPPCSPLSGPTLTFDQEVAYLCANLTGYDWNVCRGTMECGGLLAVADWQGADSEDLYLFDPTTRELVETMSGSDGCELHGQCERSRSGGQPRRQSLPALFL